MSGRTSDNGVTWSNISGQLARGTREFHCCVADRREHAVRWQRCGVFGTSDGGDTWSTSNDGPANVEVDELFWLGNKLVAVTHGRRHVRSIAPQIGPPVIVADSAALIAENCAPATGRGPPGERIIVNYCAQDTGGTATSISWPLCSDRTASFLSKRSTRLRRLNYAKAEAIQHLLQRRLVAAPIAPMLQLRDGLQQSRDGNVRFSRSVGAASRYTENFEWRDRPRLAVGWQGLPAVRNPVSHLCCHERLRAQRGIFHRSRPTSRQRIGIAKGGRSCRRQHS